MVSMALPLKPTMMSPKRTPATAAGPPAVVSTINAPLALRSPSDRASGSSRGSELTPSQPFWRAVGTLPIFTGSLTMRPSGWEGWIGAAFGGGCGATGCGGAGRAGWANRGGMTGGCASASGGCVGMRTMSMPAPAVATTIDVSGRGMGRKREGLRRRDAMGRKAGTVTTKAICSGRAAGACHRSPWRARRSLGHPQEASASGAGNQYHRCSFPYVCWSQKLNWPKRCVLFPRKQRGKVLGGRLRSLARV